MQQSRGWVHYSCHRPEPHILLFRRPLGTDPVSGKVDPEAARSARRKYMQEFGLVDEPAAKSGAGGGAGVTDTEMKK